MKYLVGFRGPLAALPVCIAISAVAYANENIVGRPNRDPNADTAISAADAAAARAPDERILTSPTQLTEKIRSVLRLPNSKQILKAFGDENHPFTTKRASSQGDISPVSKFPWRATGKLFMRFGDDTFVCTASVIEKGLLVTAAHCVHNFGEKDDGFADFVSFEPARHESHRPFKSWTAKEWWIPKVYHDGTDRCTQQAPGVVCENDIAVIVVDKNSEGKFIGDVTGKYGYKDGNYGFASFLNERVAQITQLGYPSENFDGDKMIRTDSAGYQDAPFNVIIGSNQTGGSSGGPWLQNFGVETSHTGTPPQDNDSNQVVATTSWGFIADTFKIQGASRFSKNTAYTAKSNIRSLVDEACINNPGFC